MRGWVSAFLLMLLAGMSAPAWAQDKVALVIGISDYKVGGKLPQTLIDAGKVSSALTAVGFSTTTLVDPALGKSQLEDALLTFSEKAAKADVAVLYFAGHGMQYGDDNWLIPASAELKAESHIRIQGVPLTSVVELMKQARFRIVILDACRNNPFVVNWGAMRASGDGLGGIAEARVPRGSLVAFSAAPGMKVPDNGVYADELTRWIQTDGIELKTMFDRVRRSVQDRTPDAAPEYTSKYDGMFSFRAGYNPNATSDRDAVAWRITQAADSIPAYRSFLEAYPASSFAAAATTRIVQLQQVNATPGGGKSTSQPSASVATRFAILLNEGEAARNRADYPLALKSWREACDGGNASGCTNLGVLYRNGEGVAQDYVEAQRLYRIGCDGGDAQGCSNLGYLHLSGYGVPQNYAEALRLYWKGCDGGSMQGCTNIGAMYSTGNGVPQSFPEAMKLYIRACDGGNGMGCSNLAGMYANGQGAPTNPAEATRLRARACSLGYRASCAIAQ